MRSKSILAWSLDNYVLTLLSLTLMALCFAGLGMPFLTCIIGLFLCVIGISRRQFTVNTVSLLALSGYIAWCMLSSFFVKGDAMQGYASMQAILPVLFLLIGTFNSVDKVKLRKVLVVWTALVAMANLLELFVTTFSGGVVTRVSGVFDNPNYTGVFLVLGWFTVLDMQGDAPSSSLLSKIEPLILSALVLTLSMGSYLTACVGVLIVVVLSCRGDYSFHNVTESFISFVVRAVMGSSPGLLLYLVMTRTTYTWFSVIILVWLIALMWYWEPCITYLRSAACLKCVAVAVGIIGIVIMLVIRPSALETIQERIYMIRNGLGYARNNLLFGVGSFHWHELNLLDSDKCFNSWCVHNAFCPRSR